MSNKAIEILERFGATNIKEYTLISNYGYTFELNGKEMDIRFWANSYGCYLGIWSGATDEINKAFNEEIGESYEY